MMYEYWLACVHPLSEKKKRMLREAYGSAKAIYYIEEMELKTADFLTKKDVEILKQARKIGKESIQKEWKKLKNENIHFVPYFHEKYPRKLKELSDPPNILYVKGSLPKEERLSVAIVGARRCTPYGEQMALEYGEALAESGVQIISGMARGIDGAGQRGALNRNGDTYAVLGGGVDVCYPREHKGLYEDIQRTGGVISEQLPGQPPLAAYFPLRNRIISGLSDVVLVMEAKEKSGSLITADQALEQGKEVYALPGLVTSPVSQGCHHLIRQGAGILISPEELIEELGIFNKRLRNEWSKKSDKNKKILESAEKLVYSCLGFIPKGIEQLTEETGLHPSEVLETLITLELEGCIKEISKNYYVRAR